MGEMSPLTRVRVGVEGVKGGKGEEDLVGDLADDDELLEDVDEFLEEVLGEEDDFFLRNDEFFTRVLGDSVEWFFGLVLGEGTGVEPVR